MSNKNIINVHAARVANNVAKIYMNTKNTGRFPQNSGQLVQALKKLVMDFDSYFAPAIDGQYSNDDDKRMTISAVAYESLMASTGIVLGDWSELFINDRHPTAELTAELDKVCMENYRTDPRSHKHLDKMYVPCAPGDDEKKAEVADRYKYFISEELAFAAGKLLTILPGYLKGRGEDATFNSKTRLEPHDIVRLSTVELLPIPDANDSASIDHASQDISEWLDTSTIPVFLDSVELEHASYYQARFDAWYLFADKLDDDSRIECIEQAAARVVQNAEYGMKMMRDNEKRRVDNVFGAAA